MEKELESDIILFIVNFSNKEGDIMNKLTFDYSKAKGFLLQNEIECMEPFVKVAHDMIHNKTGEGNDQEERIFERIQHWKREQLSGV